MDSLKIIYAQEPLYDLYNTIMLCGPSPRSDKVKSWRPDFIESLKNNSFTGTVLIPESSDGIWKSDYISQVQWELDAIHSSDLIIFWIPRVLPDMPAFTTNVEFGYCIAKSQKSPLEFNVMYGRPKDAEKISYLDYLNSKHNICFPIPFNDIDLMTKSIVEYFI